MAQPYRRESQEIPPIAVRTHMMPYQIEPTSKSEASNSDRGNSPTNNGETLSFECIINVSPPIPHPYPCALLVLRYNCPVEML